MSLDVVMISRDQRWNIERLVGSVLAETAGMPEVDVILVDSASEDGTPEAAAALGIRVVRIDPGQHLSPAAGRHLGRQLTAGDSILFLDGDAELVPGWLGSALRILDEHPGVGSVTGSRISLPTSTSPAERPDPPEDTGEWEPVAKCGGSALFRRSALEGVGGFDPFLHSDEEPDLSIRLRHHGHELVRTALPIIFDYTDPTDEIRTILARRGRRLYLGAGQNLRKHAGDPTFRTYLAERGFGILPIVAAPAYLAVCVAASRSSRNRLLAVVAMVPLAIGTLAFRKGSIHKALHSLVLRALIAEGTIRGLRLPVRDPASYRPTYRTISPD